MFQNASNHAIILYHDAILQWKISLLASNNIKHFNLIACLKKMLSLLGLWHWHWLKTFFMCHVKVTHYGEVKLLIRVVWLLAYHISIIIN